MRQFALLAAALLGLGTVALGAGPAEAHGALTTPTSRSAACGEVGTPDSPVCQAARAASGGAPIDWPNLRLPDVNGRDRQVVPDGKLCSAGKPEFAGLDLIRADWPVTSLKSGQKMTFRYGETIPHQGTFRLYLTKAGYDPKRPLRWADLDTRPFLSVTDPPLRNDAYTFSGTLPARTGRHLIYTIWQNSSTVDTYYSCSDVFLTGSRAPARGAGPAPAAPRTPTRSPAAAAPVPPASAAGNPSGDGSAAGPADGPGLARTAQRVTTQRSFSWPLVVGGAFAAFALVGAFAMVYLRRGRHRPRGRRGEF